LRNNFNLYLLYAHTFEDYFAAIFARNLTDTKNIYVSIPGAKIIRRILFFIKYDTNTIQIAHGRVSSDKFLVYTKYVLTELKNYYYAMNSIKEKKIYINESFLISKNSIALFLHGYQKGSPYGWKHLYSDFKFILKLSKQYKKVILRPHPTAFLLKKFCSFSFFSSYLKLELSFSNDVQFNVSDIYVSSPTYKLKLNEKKIPYHYCGH
jgi:hypothetical protein